MILISTAQTVLILFAVSLSVYVVSGCTITLCIYLMYWIRLKNRTYTLYEVFFEILYSMYDRPVPSDIEGLSIVRWIPVVHLLAIALLPFIVVYNVLIKNTIIKWMQDTELSNEPEKEEQQRLSDIKLKNDDDGKTIIIR